MEKSGLLHPDIASRFFSPRKEGNVHALSVTHEAAKKFLDQEGEVECDNKLYAFVMRSAEREDHHNSLCLLSEGACVPWPRPPRESMQHLVLLLALDRHDRPLFELGSEGGQFLYHTRQGSLKGLLPEGPRAFASREEATEDFVRRMEETTTMVPVRSVYVFEQERGKEKRLFLGSDEGLAAYVMSMVEELLGGDE